MTGRNTFAKMMRDDVHGRIIAIDEEGIRDEGEMIP